MLAAMYDPQIDSRRQNILNQAANLFGQKGYSATSMKDIAEAIGIQTPSLYNHLQSKQEILQVLLLFIARLFHEGILQIYQRPASHTEKLQQVVKMHIRIATDHQQIAPLLLQEWKQLEEPAYSEFADLRRKYHNLFKTILEEGIAAGEFKALNADITLNLILSALKWIYGAADYYTSHAIKPEDIESCFAELVFNGLLKQ